MRPFRLFFISLLIGLLLIACSSQPAPETPEAIEAKVEEATAAPAEEASEEAAAEDTPETETTEATAEGFPRTVIDGQGREVTFEAPPQRVMCFYTDCVEGLVGLGLKPAIVPEWFQEFISITLMKAPGGMSDVELIPLDDGTPSSEAIAAATPELVMVYSQEEAQALAEVAPTFVTYPVNTIEDVIENLRRYAQIFGLEAEAEAAIERFTARRTAYGLLASGDLRVMNVREDSGDLTGGNLRVRSTSSPDCVLLEEIAQCPWVDPQALGSWDFQTTVEYLLQEDPDVILISTYGGGNGEAMRQQVAGDPLWGELSAVKNGKLVIIDDDLTADGIVIATRFLDHIAPALYPDIFPEPLTDEQAQEILAGGAVAEATSAFPVTIEHKFGSATIPAKPERVVSLGFTDQDYLLALGVVPVGIRDWFGDQPNAVWPWARHLLGGAEPEALARELNFEHIARLQPDLIVAIYTSLTQEEYDLLNAIAPTITQPPGMDDYAITWQEQTRYTGQIVGQTEHAEELVARLEEKIAKARADHPEFEGTEYAFASVYGGDYYLYGEQSTASRFLTSLGFVVPEDVLELTANDSDYLIFSAERMDLVDRPLTLWSEGLSDEGVVGLLEDPLYSKLPVHTEGRDIFLGLDLYGGAFSFSSVLSLDMLVDDLVPAMVLALDGDPATAPKLSP